MCMYLIIGLGNPGKEFEKTRHNVGFLAVDVIAQQDNAKFGLNKKLNVELAKAKLKDKSVILVKPQGFVNKSGEAIKRLKLFYRAKAEEIIVVHDDFDIEFGDFKLSFAKDSGGHRGVQSIIDHLKTNKFWRLRIGTANRKLITARHQRTLKQKREAVGGFVLSKFTRAEQQELKKILKKAFSRLEEILS